MREELEQSPRQALINYMAGAGVSDPASMKSSIEGIELMCADVDTSTVVCSWADLNTVGTATWRFEGVEIEQAAGLTEQFLDELRVVDQLPD